MFDDSMQIRLALTACATDLKPIDYPTNIGALPTIDVSMHVSFGHGHLGVLD